MHLENKQNGHYKFYEIWAGSYLDKQTGKANSAYVGCKFGRIGTLGRVVFRTFTGKYCEGDAYSFFYKKAEEKLREGYEEVKRKK